MSTGWAGVKRSAVAGAMLAAGFIWGFSAEVSSVFDELWLAVLTVIIPWVLLLTVALAAIVDRNVRLPSVVLIGLVLGSLAAMLFILGVFFPFALELGGRDRQDVGEELGGWSVVLPWFSMAGALGGAAVGAVCGGAAWALHFGLGQKGLDREGDTREAGR